MTATLTARVLNERTNTGQLTGQRAGDAPLTDEELVAKNVAAFNKHVGPLAHPLNPVADHIDSWADVLVLAALEQDRNDKTSSTMSEVSKRVRLSRAAMTACTDRLEQKRGFITRQPDPADRRRTTLHINEHGTNLLHKAFTFDQVAAEAAALQAKRAASVNR